ncbi:hypothetical protein pEaSNUABM29_00240 [Erwinia phage pEa_SNUABM_29]|nr:hypothetical protein pEaSNUABM29_00240 [Erwinia phage pEa_SNUABM_29]
MTEATWNPEMKSYTRVMRETRGLTDSPQLFGRGMTTNPFSRFWADVDAPALSSQFDEKDHILRSIAWHSALLARDKVDGVPTRIVTHLLDMTPMIEISNLRRRYIRPAQIREAYLLEAFKVDAKKLWFKMDDHRFRAEITDALETMLALKRAGIEHEGFEAAINAWVRKNK